MKSPAAIWISAEFLLYQRNFTFISDIPNISAKSQFYQRNINNISEKTFAPSVPNDLMSGMPKPPTTVLFLSNE
ncbi:hypothetical protein [Bacillus sp. CH30_1T]|uniref:hypothetical protein n=1 Tax=Bacillus sp. CH30_1T TaxID=2604836 RepID=UPI001CAA83AF|nr:hypothetical protein [Bacillus sp. CH30_1T]